MTNGFWGGLPKGFTVLAPMEDVTDTVFRQIIASVARPDVFFTEFTNVDAIWYSLGMHKDRARLPVPAMASAGHGLAARDFVSMPALNRLVFSETERPIVAQIWGTEPEKFKKAAEVIKGLSFDGIDINLGCPVRDVVKQGACGGMICDVKSQDTRHKVQEIIKATKEGAGGLPVSVKTRIGNKKIITEDWIGFLLEQDLAAITVHGRTVTEQSLVPAHWDEIGKAVKLRDGMKSKTLIIGNGDVDSYENYESRIMNYGVDGVMIGRGVFKNPWIFDKSQDFSHTPQDKIRLLKKHLELWQETWGDRKHFALMKKYVKMYVNGFDGASELRARMMECKSLGELKEMVKMCLVS